MSATTPCIPCCDTPQSVNVPGTAGASAITSTTASFVIPADDGVTSVTVAVTDSSYLATNSNLFIGGANFLLTGINSATSISVRTVGASGDTAPGATVASGALVICDVGRIDLPLVVLNGGTGASTAAGARTNLGLGAASLLADPIPVANGGTGSATKPTAQVALGLGQTATAVYSSGIAYALTTTPTLVTGATITPASAGLYLLIARVTLDLVGATFAASRAITFKLRNITAGADIANTSTVVNTQAQTTTSFPSFHYSLATVVATLTAAQQIQIFASIATVPSAGTANITEATLIAIPLALS